MKIDEKTVQYYTSMYDKKGSTASLPAIMGAIRKGKWKEDAEIVRLGNKDHKKKLVCFIPTGTFRATREDKASVTHTGLGLIDVDVELTDNQITTITNDPFVIGSFRSISGKGAAFFVKLKKEDFTAKEHKELMRGFIEYFEATYKLTVDPTCVNLARLRYVAYDPHAIFLPSKVETPWSKKKVQETAEILPSTSRISNNLPEEIAYDRTLEKYLAHAGHFNSSSSRHEWLYLLAVWCNRAGISASYTQDKLTDNQYAIPERDWKKETTRTIKHVYSQGVGEHGGKLQSEWYSPEDMFKYPQHVDAIFHWFLKRKMDYVETKVSEGGLTENTLEIIKKELDFMVNYYNSKQS